MMELMVDTFSINMASLTGWEKWDLMPDNYCIACIDTCRQAHDIYRTKCIAR